MLFLEESPELEGVGRQSYCQGKKGGDKKE